MPSTVIASFHYNVRQKILRIRFVSGRIYDYTDVPEQVFSNMKEAFSKGVYFNEHIKDHYKFQLVK